MLRKSRIFYFFSSLIITVVVGYFAWSAVISVGGGFINKILSYTDKISADFFSASVLQKEPQIGDIIFDVNLASYDDVNEAPAEEVIQNPLVITEESRQDLLDDIQEKLDIIQQQVNELIAEQNQNDQADKLDEDLKDQDSKENEKTEEAVICTGQININTASVEDLDKIVEVGLATAQKIIQARPFYSLNDLLKVSGIGEKTLQKITEQGCAYVEAGIMPIVSGGGGGGSAPAPIVYPKILISEVQIAGLNDAKEEFVELYNPSLTDVDLTNWYLQKKTKSGSVTYFGKKSLFSGYKISANGYLLIAREGYFINLVDIPTTEALSDNSSLIFNNPNDEISDQVSWLEIKDGLSWCADFQICALTPKAPNEAYSEPIVIDITAPAITLIGDSEIIINVGDTYVDEGATALDDIDGDITANIIVVNPVDAETAGDYTITYNVSDEAGNNAVEVTRSVHVVAVVLPPPLPTDIIPPTGTIIINDGALYANSRDVVLTISATDDISGVAEMNIANWTSYSGWEPYAISKNWKLPETNGTKTVRVKFRDVAGNESKVGISTTTILDTVAPVITLNGDSTINLDVGGTYQEFGATITDANPGSLIIGGDTVGTAIPATFHVTYDTVDLAGENAIQVVRTIIVNEIEN